MLVVTLVPLGALAALGGTYSSSTLPILAGAIVAFFAVGARVGGPATRALDGALGAVATAVVLQLVPLPRGVVEAVSPHAETLRVALYLDTLSGPATLSADPRLTRAGLASLASALLVFWAARDAFGQGGVRVAARAIAVAGFVVTLVALVQSATAPDLLLWTWKPADPESKPFGPFVNRNHLATWLLMGGSLTAGYLMSHRRALGLSHASWRLRLRDWLADGVGLLLAGTLLVMVVGIVATLSRAAILGAGAALATGIALSQAEERGRAVRLGAASLALLLAVTVWANREALARKFDAVTTASRITIWQETVPIIRDFWLTGTGTGTYGPAMLQYQRTSRTVHFNQAHSEYLQVAAEGGVLLVGPIVVAVLIGLRLARRQLREDARARAWLRIGAAAGLAGVAVQGLFETGLRTPANALLAALLAAVAVHHRHDR